MAGNAFCTDRNPLTALRICLGGVLNREDCARVCKADMRPGMTVLVNGATGTLGVRTVLQRTDGLGAA